MSKVSYVIGDQIRRFGTWLAWNPLRLLAVLILILLVWLIAAGQSAREDADHLLKPTTTASSGLPEGWQSWPIVTAQPR